LSRGGETEPILLIIVIGVEVRFTDVDFAIMPDTIFFGFAQSSGGLRLRVVGAARVHGPSGREKNRHSESDTNHHWYWYNQ
jgi:hypothetical protein